MTVPEIYKEIERLKRLAFEIELNNIKERVAALNLPWFKK